MFKEEQLKKWGIIDWGYTEEPKPRTWPQFEEWIDQGHNQPLGYLSDHRKDIREDLKNFYPEFQSALVFLFSYQEERMALKRFYESKESNGFKIASYALSFNGEDYHQIIRERLKAISETLPSEFEAKLSLDIHPVLERDLAYRAGLGWFGKNSMLIHPKQGSFLMIGALLLSKKMELSSRSVEVDHCGQCTACITACPTLAIDPQKRTIMADKCISTWTIELFNDQVPPPKGMKDGGGEVFGCDICQDVCPWNKRLERMAEGLNEWRPEGLAQKVKTFFLIRPLIEVIKELEELSNRAFVKRFKGTPLERTGRKGILKTLLFYGEKKP
jgi:epoxyqueuosine reductase